MTEPEKELSSVEAQQPLRVRVGEQVFTVNSNVLLGTGSLLLADRLLRSIGTPEERREALDALHDAATDLDTALASISNVESYPAAELRAARDAIAGAVEPFEELLWISERATDSLRRYGLEFDSDRGQAVARTGKPGPPAHLHRELIAELWRFEVAGQPGPGEPEEIPKTGWYAGELLARVKALGCQFGIPDAELTLAKIKSAIQTHHNVPGAVRSKRQRGRSRS